MTQVKSFLILTFLKLNYAHRREFKTKREYTHNKLGNRVFGDT